ncbi:hypothetical protein HQ560_04010 [bacterium]|nr:hypothetical protein [bacterium]
MNHSNPSHDISPTRAGPFAFVLSPEGLTSLKHIGHPRGPEFIAPGQTLGPVRVRYRADDGPWLDAEPDAPLAVEQRFEVNGAALVWTLDLHNRSDRPLEVGDVAMPLPMHTLYPKVTDDDAKEEIFTRRVFRHALIAGHGSFVYWLPVGGVGPHLVMIPQEDAKLEYFTEERSSYAHGGSEYSVFIHSAATGAEEARGTWRQKHTSLELAPYAFARRRFAFRWAEDADGVRDVLVRSGGFDVHVAPGMVVPEDLEALIAVRTRNAIDALVPEFADETHVERLPQKDSDIHCFRVRFERLGENRLTLRSSGGREMALEFFVTQPLETLVKKRAAFIAGKQQHRDPDKWYDGLFSLWDTRLPEGQNLLGPDNLGGQHPYAVSGSDDPSNSKCIYLAEKNVAYPDPAEIAALEYFIDHFVWGKHQRTDAEAPYPYGIYGSEDWRENRSTDRDPLEEHTSRPGGPSQCRMWRSFDYTTYFALYYNMYRIARQVPSLDAERYLDRAAGTARAFFDVPYNIRMDGGWGFNGWTDWAYTIGNFHEKYLLGILDALEAEGRREEADALRAEWEKKVKYFLYDDAYPFISEMPVDSTAYESTYAVARYALTHGLEPDKDLWQDKNSGKSYSHPDIDPVVHEDFLRRQLQANLACRGWLEAGYSQLGSDFRGCGSSFYTLSYMSQMGGWAILDQALRFEANPAPLVRLGVASLLSSWALVNAGQTGGLHDGAAGWGFMPQKFACDWNPATQGIPRGAWPVDGEIDHGLAAYVETASTVVLDDPLFGLIALCGELTAAGDTIHVIPRDGIRQRLHVLLGDTRLSLTLDSDGFARDRPIILAADLSTVAIPLESRSPEEHTTRLTVAGLPDGPYAVLADGRKLDTLEGKGVVDVPAAAAVTIRRETGQ